MADDSTYSTTWIFDPAHSEITFKVKHLVISTVTGQFHKFDGKIKSDGDDFEHAEIYFEADVNSIDTRNKDRDAHLKSDDFFDAENHPKIIFESKTFEKTGESDYKLHGNLTMRGTTKPVTLDARHGGTVVDAAGQTKAGFEVQGEVNRKEYGLKWDAVTEAGSVVVGDKVQLQLNIQLAKEE